jgi:hypothetical protein
VKVLLLAVSLAIAAPRVPTQLRYVFTRAESYSPQAWRDGGERFPAGATVIIARDGVTEALAPELDSSADPAVSWDAKRVLFSGRQTRSDTWQIWEKDLSGGAARRISSCDTNCINPLYLPGDKVVYTRQMAGGTLIESAGLRGGAVRRLTFAGGYLLTDDVLADGRILLEGALASANGERRPSDLFVIYPDGTGLESLRCASAHDRTGGRQTSSGDIVFQDGEKLARFGTAYKEQSDFGQLSGAIAPVADDGEGRWLFARLSAKGANLVVGRSTLRGAGLFNVQPAMLRVGTQPRDFPSGLLKSRQVANALGVEMVPDARKVRVYLAGATREATIERDGSFYISLPGDEPIRFELLDAQGRSIASENEWIWMRKGEQRICNGCHVGPERVARNRLPDALRHINPSAP